jgi:superfamily II DNA/RNA helicase
MNKKTKTSFAAFHLDAALMSAINKVGYISPTDIQSDAIPAILKGGDVLAGAETGSGKTAAFVLPLLHKIIEQKRYEGWAAARGSHIRALILVPTRELVVQIRDEVKALAQDVSPEIRCMSVYGGVKLDSQIAAIRSGCDVLIATPNRVLELAAEKAVVFNKLQSLVLDEADRLVDSHFMEDVESVFKLLPNKRQNLLFTATFPESIRDLVRRLLYQPTIINHEHKTEYRIDQHAVTVNYDKKAALLAHLLKENDWKQVLIFCSAKKTCDRLVEKLADDNVEAVALHGNKVQKERLSALDGFKSGKVRVLVATDVASRGVDVLDLDCVINYELPRSPNDYIHRIGRTGRAGRNGQAISLISHHEYAHFQVIEKRNGLRLEREQVEGFEASENAPPPPKRNKPKKKSKKPRLSKKKRLKLLKKKQYKPFYSRPRATDNKENEETGRTETKGAKATKLAKKAPRNEEHQSQSKKPSENPYGQATPAKKDA